ncbi:MAG: adenosylmethionine decarboxylase [Flavobacteriales bacterium]|jgi:S-adenosylmethionine decarboxylase|nr:adenosylmethionine decarboxylase [Flavobacteriales bacterium]
MNKHLGNQVTIDFYDCSYSVINSVEKITEIMEGIAKYMGLHIVNTTIHAFSPIGVSGVVVIEESHIAVHTWPEYGFVAIDFFTCNQTVEILKAKAWLKEQLESQKEEIQEIKRGNPAFLNKKTPV